MERHDIGEKKLIARKYSELSLIQERMAKLTSCLAQAAYEFADIAERLANYEDGSET